MFFFNPGPDIGVGNEDLGTYGLTTGLRFLEAKTFTGAEATADFTAFDSTKYDAYQFVFQNVVPASDNVNLNMFTSANGGSSYDSGAANYRYGARAQVLGSTGSDTGNASTTAITIMTAVGSAASEDGVSGEVFMPGPHLAKRTQVFYRMLATDFSAASYLTVGAGVRLSSADVNAVRFSFASGNLESGKITMYGLANSNNV